MRIQRKSLHKALLYTRVFVYLYIYKKINFEIGCDLHLTSKQT